MHSPRGRGWRSSRCGSEPRRSPMARRPKRAHSERRSCEHGHRACCASSPALNGATSTAAAIPDACGGETANTSTDGGSTHDATSGSSSGSASSASSGASNSASSGGQGSSGTNECSMVTYPVDPTKCEPQLEREVTYYGAACELEIAQPCIRDAGFDALDACAICSLRGRRGSLRVVHPCVVQSRCGRDHPMRRLLCRRQSPTRLCPPDRARQQPARRTTRPDGAARSRLGRRVSCAPRQSRPARRAESPAHGCSLGREAGGPSCTSRESRGRAIRRLRPAGPRAAHPVAIARAARHRERGGRVREGDLRRRGRRGPGCARERPGPATSHAGNSRGGARPRCARVAHLGLAGGAARRTSARPSPARKADGACVAATRGRSGRSR